MRGLYRQRNLMDLAPAMDNGTCLPIDPDYIGQHPPYGASDHFNHQPTPMAAGNNFNHQPTPMAAGNKQPYAINGIIVLPSLLVLFAIILFIFVICVYRGTSLYGMTNISWRRRFSFARDDPLYLRNVGLDARVIESLPVFEYKGQSFKEALECAVCLSEFEENEKARLLPNCKHTFHVDCIDMWFRSHSTCPICRRGAQPKQRIRKNNTDEISVNVELVSSGNR